MSGSSHLPKNIDSLTDLVTCRCSCVDIDMQVVFLGKPWLPKATHGDVLGRLDLIDSLVRYRFYDAKQEAMHEDHRDAPPQNVLVGSPCP